MIMSSQPNPEEQASRDMPAAERPERTTRRPAVREEFLALFRDTTRPLADEAGATDGGATRGPARTGRRAALPAPEPSRFLRQFLQQTAPNPELARSGLASLDSHLGGGFGHGLHLVLGLPGSGKTAFLESLAWEAVSTRRPVLYYALKSGGLRAWEHLIATLAAILDDPALTPAALRAHKLTQHDVETLGRLDAALQGSVLPYLALIDGTPASTRSVSALIEDMRSRSQEAVGQHMRLPLVLMDDLTHLASLTGSRSLSDLLSRLDDGLKAESVSGLLAATPADVYRGGAERRLPVRTVLMLTQDTPSALDAPDQVQLEVRKNMATGWTGSILLLLDRRSGLFAES